MWNPYHLCILHIYFLIYRTQMSQSVASTDFIGESWILKKRQEILFLLGYLLTWVVSRSWLLFPKIPGTMGRIEGCRVEGRWRQISHDMMDKSNVFFSKRGKQRKKTSKKSLSETSFLPGILMSQMQSVYFNSERSPRLLSKCESWFVLSRVIQITHGSGDQTMQLYAHFEGFLWISLEKISAFSGLVSYHDPPACCASPWFLSVRQTA